jgi:hypothetical protein
MASGSNGSGKAQNIKNWKKKGGSSASKRKPKRKEEEYKPADVPF